MKKAFLYIISCCLLFSLAGCSASQNSPQEKDKLSIVTTIFPQYDFSREIVGENADLTMLLPPGGDTHSYEPSPQDIIKIGECDLFIYTGGESDLWLENILNSVDNKDLTVLSLMEIVDPVVEEPVLGVDDHDHSEHEQGSYEYDEHVWTSPKNAIAIVEAISNKMCEIDPNNKDTYAENTRQYVEKLEELDNGFKETVSEGKRKTIVFGDRFPFRYFTDEYGLTYYAAFPGCSSQSEPSSATVISLLDIVKEEEIPVVFYIELSNQKVANAIAEDSGAETLLFHSCQTVTLDEFESGESYLSLMQKNMENLKLALQ